jgi:hypothetical protein
MRPREVTELVTSFRDIQYGRVESRNVPLDRLRQMPDFPYEVWSAFAEQPPYVEIVG